MPDLEHTQDGENTELKETFAALRALAAALQPTSGLKLGPVPNFFAVRLAPGAAENCQLHQCERPTALLVLQGSKRLYAAGRWVEVKAGQLLCVCADLPAKVCFTGGAEGYCALGMYLDREALRELAAKAPAAGRGSLPAAPAALCVFKPELELVKALLRLGALNFKERELSLRAGPLSADLMALLLLSPAGTLLSQSVLPTASLARTARTLSLLRQSPERQWSLEELAGSALLSPSTLQRCCRELTGLSPLQYLKSVRLIKARRLIEREGRSASEAALEVGYVSVSQFGREFKRRFDLTPGELKRRPQNAQAQSL